MSRPSPGSSLVRVTFAVTCLLVAAGCQRDQSTPEVARVTVDPSIISLATQERTQLQARAVDLASNPLPSSISWSATGGTITQDGLYTASNVAGTYKVVAFDTSGISDTATVVIQAPPPPNGRLSVSPADPHYFVSADAAPIFFLGYGDSALWWKRNLYPNALQNLKAVYESNDLSFARVSLLLSLPIAEVDHWPFARTGPGTANDGGPKWDLTVFDSSFWNDVAGLLEWGDSHNIPIQFTLMAGISFKDRGATDYSTWAGCVFNPENRVNSQAANLTDRDGSPSMYDIFTPGGGWSSEADRTWVRDRLKALIDKLLAVAAPYKNWWVEIGVENDGSASWKEYWIHYIKGTTNPIDDGAISPYASPDILIEDNSNFGGDVTPLLVDAQDKHLVTTATAASLMDGMYSDGILALNDTDGSGRSVQQSQSEIRRIAWISLTHGGHFDAYDHSNDPASPPALIDGLKILMRFLRADRSGHTIEQVLPPMHPEQSIVTGGHALKHDAGQAERYLVFALAGSNPTLSVTSAGLTITRLDATTGAETAVGTTTAGANALTGTGHDTAWWIE